MAFDRSGCNELALDGLEVVFDASGEEDESIFIDPRLVTGVMPAVPSGLELGSPPSWARRHICEPAPNSAAAYMAVPPMG